MCDVEIVVSPSNANDCYDQASPGGDDEEPGSGGAWLGTVKFGFFGGFLCLLFCCAS